MSDGAGRVIGPIATSAACSIARSSSDAHQVPNPTLIQARTSRTRPSAALVERTMIPNPTNAATS
jgi:hypothetical protein